MKTPAVDPSAFQASSASAYSVAARAAGVVIAAGYLVGLVQGPVVAVVGGLALITFGRNLLLEHHSAALSGGALAVIAGALGIAALRWAALDLTEIRGVQSVLGPTVSVGPTQASVAASVAAVAALAALTVWMARPWPTSRILIAWWVLEATVGSLAVATVFLNPTALTPAGGTGAIGVLSWVGVTVLVVGLVAGGGLLLQKAAEPVRAALMVASGVAVLAAAGILVSAL